MSQAESTITDSLGFVMESLGYADGWLNNELPKLQAITELLNNRQDKGLSTLCVEGLYLQLFRIAEDIGQGQEELQIALHYIKTHPDLVNLADAEEPAEKVEEQPDNIVPFPDGRAR